MIEIDARISNISFSILDESVSFQDQVLFFKSKSIVEVVKLMLNPNKIDLLLVGILVLLFSVVFPFSKLISSAIYLYFPKSHSNTIIQFLVFKTGKWSMADVMVVAIFMSYIGFSGIISEQLKQIEHLAHNVDILTTNQSKLLIGFYAFTTFVILSLLTSHKIQAVGKLEV
jgi:Paraquat-inducible protein A